MIVYHQQIVELVGIHVVQPRDYPYKFQDIIYTQVALFWQELKWNHRYQFNQKVPLYVPLRDQSQVSYRLQLPIFTILHKEREDYVYEEEHFKENRELIHGALSRGRAKHDKPRVNVRTYQAQNNI